MASFSVWQPPFMPGLKARWRDFSGGPAALCFHCRGHGFDPWVRTKILPAMKGTGFSLLPIAQVLQSLQNPAVHLGENERGK